MLVTNSRLIGTPILSVQAGAPIAKVSGTIVDPNDLKIIAFRLSGPLASRGQNLLDVRSIREYSNFGMVVDSAEEFAAPGEIVHIDKVLSLNFDLLNLKVETKKGSKLGKVIDFTVTSEDFIVQQIIVKRPAIKALIDPELTISRKEIVEVTDYKVIVKDEEKVLKARAEKEDFVPNFVNPFRNHEPGFAPADNQTPADKDKQ